MLQNFMTFVNFSLIPASDNACAQLNRATDVGGVYGKGANSSSFSHSSSMIQFVSDTFGFGIQMAANGGPGDVKMCCNSSLPGLSKQAELFRCSPRPNNSMISLRLEPVDQRDLFDSRLDLVATSALPIPIFCSMRPYIFPMLTSTKTSVGAEVALQEWWS